MRPRLTHRCALLVAIGGMACARAAPSVPPASQPCMFSGAPKSGLAWESGPGSFSVSGRVVSLHDGAPLEHATVRLTPGPHYAQTDRAGAFRVTGLRGGRYYMEVLSIGRVKAADSVTIGDDGLRVVAVIASHTGDIQCIRAMPTR